MRKNAYFLNILLAVLVVGLCLWGMLVRAFAPSVLVPHVSIPWMVLLTVLALVAEKYFGGSMKREWIGSVVLGALTLSLFPVCAGLAGHAAIWKLFLSGAAVFAVTTLLYTSMCKRMASGPAARLAPLINALMLFLASQFFQGIL